MTLVEPCCGTAALTLHLLGARRQLVPRQGSKWRLRRELAAMMSVGPPARVVLSDASPWALVIREVLGNRAALLRHLGGLVADGERDPRALHSSLSGAAVPEEPARMAAELLWLQRMAFAGKCVRVVDGRWSSPGLNLTSALGVAKTERFGAVRPLGQSLLGVVRAAPQFDVAAAIGLARPSDETGQVVVYLDPPYSGTTGYGPGDLNRAGVVALAEEWAASGAAVFVSEATAVDELVAQGWSSAPLGAVGGQSQLFRAKHRTEWVTWRGQAQASLWVAA